MPRETGPTRFAAGATTAARSNSGGSKAAGARSRSRARGTLALDGGLQPVGAFSARIEGFSETLDALRQVGAMSGRDALTAKMVLTALARREGEGRPYLTIPLALQERRLYAGPVALLTVPALPW